MMRSALVAVGFALFVALLLWLAMRFISPAPVQQGCELVGTTWWCPSPPSDQVRKIPEQKSA